jgi:tRNA(Ile)-lysidine synthetase-like protein
VTALSDIDNLGEMGWNFNNLGQQWERSFELISKQYRGVAVACSGGIDSTVLFHLLCDFLKAKKNFLLSLVHVNFRLRGEDSDRDQAFVEELAKKNFVEFQAYRVSDEELAAKGESGTQLWARNIRYRFFETFTKNGLAVALAHQLDDVAENALLRMARGVSCGNLAGMSELALPYWRPLLLTPKYALEEYALLHGITHCEDATNAKIDYSRNRIRHKVIPELDRLYTDASTRIANLAFESQEMIEYCRAILRKQLAEFKSEKVPAEFLKNLPAAVAFEALSLLLVSFNERSGKQSQKRQYSRRLFESILTRLCDKNAPNCSWVMSVAGKAAFNYSEGYVWFSETTQTFFRSEHERELKWQNHQ